jgi:phosphatidylserine/phosphatidylglycerophosphate/cardiolipin synthase-like enzyme
MRRLLLVINFTALITLGFFAKDNILQWLAPRATATIADAGTIEVQFSPKLGATKSIINALARARKTILVSAYSFTSTDIAEALLAAKKRGVSIKIILDKSQVSQRYSASTFFANQGFDLRINDKHAIFHNKVMVIDGDTVITGSFNFTKAAENKNAENLLIIRANRQVAKAYEENFWSHWQHSVAISDYQSLF